MFPLHESLHGLMALFNKINGRSLTLTWAYIRFMRAMRGRPLRGCALTMLLIMSVFFKFYILWS